MNKINLRIALVALAVVVTFQSASRFFVEIPVEAAYENAVAVSEPVYVTTVVTPTTGSTVALDSQRRQMLLLDPAGTLLNLTITLPDNPQDKDVVVVGTSKAITTLTMNVGAGGSTLLSPLTTMILGGNGRWIYNASVNKWFKIG